MGHQGAPNGTVIAQRVQMGTFRRAALVSIEHCGPGTSRRERARADRSHPSATAAPTLSHGPGERVSEPRSVLLRHALIRVGLAGPSFPRVGCVRGRDTVRSQPISRKPEVGSEAPRAGQLRVCIRSGSSGLLESMALTTTTLDEEPPTTLDERGIAPQVSFFEGTFINGSKEVAHDITGHLRRDRQTRHGRAKPRPDIVRRDEKSANPLRPQQLLYLVERRRFTQVADVAPKVPEDGGWCVEFTACNPLMTAHAVLVVSDVRKRSTHVATAALELGNPSPPPLKRSLTQASRILLPGC